MNRSLAEHVRGELRAEIARQGLTGTDVARRMGIYPQWISRRLSGELELSVPDLERIATALAVPVHKFFEGSAA